LDKNRKKRYPILGARGRLQEATIPKYIQEQKTHDIAMGKLSVKEYEAPLMGKPSNTNTLFRAAGSQ